MITMSSSALSAVRRSWVMHTAVESWLGDQLLADSVPIASGTLDVDRTLRVPERISLTVPREDRGVSWSPETNDHPLAAYGQQLRVSIGISLGNDVIEWLSRGWFVITDSDADGDTVSVQASGLLQLIDEARFVLPFQPTGTFVSTLRNLVEPALTVDTTLAPTDRAVPGSMSWDEDRLGGVFELLDAWPAEASVDSNGVLVVTATDDPTVPVLSLTDGVGGTVVKWAGSSTRDGACSVVVARGQAADGGQVQGVASDIAGNSALRLGGPFNPLPVPEFFFSPLLTTVTQCQKAATTILKRKRRNAARRVTATCVPHPGIEDGDLISVTGAGLVNAPCVVETVTLPLTPASGAMTLGLRVV